MIPPREELKEARAGLGHEQERAYTADEIELLETFRPVIREMTEDERMTHGMQLLRNLWPDELEFMRKTHWIKTKKPGVVVLFKPNIAQQRFYDHVYVPARKEHKPVRVIILKARQLGFSTFMQCFNYLRCVEKSRQSSLTVSFDKESTEELFQKVMFVRRNEWFPHPAHRARGNKLELTNDSTFFTRTAGSESGGRSQTFHHFHASEIPMWADADESLASILPAIPEDPETSIVFESTARGAVGPFYNMWKGAERGENGFTPFFAPWFWDPTYTRPLPSTAYRDRFEKSLDFNERRMRDRLRLSLDQLHWRRWKIEHECQGSVNKFKQEYPSTAAEAFLTTGSSVFDPEAVAELENNARPPLWTGEVELIR